MYIAVLLLVVLVVTFVMIIFLRQRNTYRLLVEQYQKYAEQKQDVSAHPEEQESGEKEEADRVLFDRIEKMMREDKVYRKKSITRDDLAEMLGSNRTYVSRAINKYSGKTFSDYINMWRVVEATLIMADTTKDIPLKQLAEDLGYSSLPVFHRSFQKETGVTAGKYMKELRSRYDRTIDTIRQN